MASGTRARSLEELIEIINQALDEVEDLRASIAHVEEYMGEASSMVEPVSTGLKNLPGAINDDSYQPGRDDWLKLLDPLRDINHRAVPFWPLLKLILETREKGYQVGEVQD